MIEIVAKQKINYIRANLIKLFKILFKLQKEKIVLFKLFKFKLFF